MQPNPNTLPGVLLIALLLSLLLPLILAPIMLAAYKRHLRYLACHEIPGDPIEPEPSDLPSLHRILPPNLLLDAKLRQLRCGLAYVLGGALCAVALTSAFLREAGNSHRLAFLTILTVNLWPVLLSLAVILRWDRKRLLRYSLLYLLVWVLLFLLQRAHGGKVTLFQMAFLFIALNGLPTLLSLLISMRRLRQIAPTLVPFCLLVIVGPVTVLFGAKDFGIDRWVVHVISTLTLRNVALAFLFSASLLVTLGWCMARILILLYRSRRMSDQSLLLDCIWFFGVGAMQGIIWLTPTGHESGAGSLWTIAAFPLYLLGVTLTQWFVRRANRKQPTSPRLPVLRAFALGPKAELVFQPVTRLWRYLGPVSVIAGYDFAASTVQPDAFLEFASGRLLTLFIHSRDALAKRLATASLSPDPDGRFRISEFFCEGKTWQIAVQSLLASTDLVLGDFRGLGGGEFSGCEWEIGELAHSVGLPRCVFLLDGPDDVDRLHKILRDNTKPPAFNPLETPLHIIQGDSTNLAVVQRILSELAAAALATRTSPPPA